MTDMVIPPEAVDAACLAMNDGVRTSHYHMRWEPEVRTILTAAYPAIRQQVAEEIAAKADEIAEECARQAKVHRGISIEKGDSSDPKGARHMRTAIAFNQQAAGAWAVAEAAREIGDRS